MRQIVRAFFLLLIPAAAVQSQAANKPVTIGITDTIASATLKERRPFLVYTPPSYNDTTYLPRRYPVLYLNDGQNLFEPERAFGGTTWQVAEVAEYLVRRRIHADMRSALQQANL